VVAHLCGHCCCTSDSPTAILMRVNQAYLYTTTLFARNFAHIFALLVTNIGKRHTPMPIPLPNGEARAISQAADIVL